jgi:hypothetical protein
MFEGTFLDLAREGFEGNSFPMGLAQSVQKVGHRPGRHLPLVAETHQTIQSRLGNPGPSRFGNGFSKAAVRTSLSESVGRAHQECAE